VHGRIFVIDVDGSHRRQLTARAAANAGFAWSPDGRKIVYERPRGGGIYLIDVDGTRDRRLTSLPGREFSWSPDGRAIAFAGVRGGRGDIYVMNADGSDQRRLTHTPDDDAGPVWSPKRR
jgi:TolB protein